MKKTLRRWIYILPLLVLTAACLLPMRRTTNKLAAPPIAAGPAKPQTAPASQVFHWGNAENSATQDGTGFFNRERNQIFANHLAPQDRPFAINLLSRAFVPQAGLTAAENILSADPSALQTVYLQFPEQLSEEDRVTLAKAGLELLNYVDGRAWTVRATSSNLRNALQNGMARAVASIDPRDKLNPEVFAERVPSYAQLEDGRIRFNIITQNGVQAADFEQLPGTEIIATALPASVLGLRFGLETDLETAHTLASLDAVTYVGFGTPPVAARDATLDSTSNITDVRDNPPNLTGAGVNVAVREIGHPMIHEDLDGQLNLIESTGSSTSSEVSHSSAVCGIIAGKGITSPTAKGVAPGSKAFVYALNDDPFGPSDIVDAGKRNARISNHSYGPADITVFGDYDPISADTDSAIRDNNLIGFFAGNEEVGGNFKHIDFYCGAKNTICVTMDAASANAGDDSPPVAAQEGLSAYSEHGPMNDGRVKPDITAFGDTITVLLGLNSTKTSIGTSFSCPAVSGMTALLFQHYTNVVGRQPSGALAKAILLNTASDVGNPGPDAKNGFGIANIEAAVKLVSARQSAQVTPMAEGVAKNGSTTTFTLNVASPSQLRITLVWMDAAGNPTATKALVNDLDLELVSPSAVTYFPFSLNPASPEAPATATGANTVDNVEQTVVANPEAGAWTVRVKGTSVAMGPQPFALAVSGGTFALDTAPVLGASPNNGPAPLMVSFDTTGSSGTILNYDWDFGDGATQSGASLATLTHTYASPGVYVATVTLNGGSSAAVVIRVNKTAQVATIKGAKITLSFKQPAGFEDDQISFSLKATNLIQSKDAVKANLKSGAYEGTKLFVNLGGGADRNPEPLRILEAVLDKKAKAKIDKNTLAYNPKTGEVKVAIKAASLEDILAALGMTRTITSSGHYFIPIEVENDSFIFRQSVPVNYKATLRSGSAKQAKE